MLTRHFLIAILLFMSLKTYPQSDTLPVSPHASAEAVALLKYIYSMSGKQTLAGQHCAPLLGSTRLSVAHRVAGDYPAVFGQDFGFSYPGHWDGINYRQNVVDEAIRRHGEGFIITLMWHAIPPTLDEPVDFEKGIQSKLSDAEWKELITPGTRLNERWKSQVDVVAWFLKQLQYAHVPVIWRPYHEMNGDWFWWGKKRGEDGYKKLYRMMFDRLVHFHGLNNLLWVYNTNEVKAFVDPHRDYYPGGDVVDILATDVYKTGYNKENYEQLLALANGKPIALGEVGDLPAPSVFKKQPRWSWFMLWWDPTESLKELYGAEEVITRRRLPWVTTPQPTVHYPVVK